MDWTAVIVGLASSGATAGVAVILFRRKMKAVAASVAALKDLGQIRLLYEIKHGKLAADLRKIF